MDTTVNINEFIEYFKNISAVTDDDNTFVMIITNTWGLRGDNSQIYKRKQHHEEAAKAAPQEPVDFLPSQKTQNVFRSGMGSNDNPLNTTKDYYPPVNNASRGNFTGAMGRTPQYYPDDDESIISGQSN